ncbi:MAG: hypothetical protein EB078_10950, partial [Proteobacteria bacterium]|nr:hypothetical protein [Pseudomonadota bacterium]
IAASDPIPPIEQAFQEEIREFFEWLGVSSHIHEKKEPWVVADVGTKNFSVAPVIDEMFKELGEDVVIHGIEIDAYRRLTNFHTRADYGNFFAEKARSAFYHPVDFLKFQKPCDLIFLLNPFVSEGPTLAWGLPLKHLCPDKMFRHAYQLLKEQNGKLILSSPSEDEFQLARTWASKAGFLLGSPITWKPQKYHVQKKPRWGCICLIP